MTQLRAWLKPNHLTADTSDYTAVPDTLGGVGMEQIIADMQFQGVELQKETIIDIVNRFNRLAAQRVTEGYTVNTGLVNMRPMIKGVFHGTAVDPEKHRVYISITQGIDLRKAVSGTQIAIQGVMSDIIAIHSVTDAFTGKRDGSLTKGRNAEIRGAFIKVVGDGVGVGVAFTKTDTGTRTLLDAHDIVINEPSRVLIMVPASLAAGTYDLSLTTQFTGSNKTLKNPRTVIYKTKITIA